MRIRRSRRPAEKTGSCSAVGNRASLCIQIRPIVDLNPSPKNPRRHPERQMKLLMKNIERFGLVVPILIDAKGTIIAGHARWEVAKRLGWSEVPTICLDHLSEAEALALTIADNRLAEISDWDNILLAEALKDLAGLDLTFELDTLGFDAAGDRSSHCKFG